MTLDVDVMLYTLPWNIALHYIEGFFLFFVCVRKNRCEDQFIICNGRPQLNGIQRNKTKTKCQYHESIMMRLYYERSSNADHMNLSSKFCSTVSSCHIPEWFNMLYRIIVIMLRKEGRTIFCCFVASLFFLLTSAPYSKRNKLWTISQNSLSCLFPLKKHCESSGGFLVRK